MSQNPSNRPPDGPPPVHRGYLDALGRRTRELAEGAVPYATDHVGAPPEVVAALSQAVSDLEAELVELSHDLHAHPEEGYAEHRSVGVLADLLAAHGLTPEVGVHGLDTALRVTTGHTSGHTTGPTTGPTTGHAAAGPRVAVLAEYDALPGIGHACGHNVIAASAVGAVLALHRVWSERDLPGEIVLLGTPAEEGGGGKVRMLDDGAFDGLDAAVMLHPFSHDVADQPFLGRRQVEAVYTGVASHASAQPFMGRNALDAVVHGYQGVAMLRQHLPDSDRVHGVITDGGARPNVVPDRAAAVYYVRSAARDTLTDLAARVDAILRSAATATGTGVEITWDPAPAYDPIRYNPVLAARWSQHQGDRGRRVLPRGVVPESLAGSTDLGNVSQRVPSMHPMIAISPEGTSLHTVEFAAAAASPQGDAAVLDGAAGLALVVADVLLDDDLRGDVAAAFQRQATDEGIPA